MSQELTLQLISESKLIERANGSYETHDNDAPLSPSSSGSARVDDSSFSLTYTSTSTSSSSSFSVSLDLEEQDRKPDSRDVVSESVVGIGFEILVTAETTVRLIETESKLVSDIEQECEQVFKPDLVLITTKDMSDFIAAKKAEAEAFTEDLTIQVLEAKLFAISDTKIFQWVKKPYSTESNRIFKLKCTLSVKRKPSTVTFFGGTENVRAQGDHVGLMELLDYIRERNKRPLVDSEVTQAKLVNEDMDRVRGTTGVDDVDKLLAQFQILNDWHQKYVLRAAMFKQALNPNSTAMPIADGENGGNDAGITVSKNANTQSGSVSGNGGAGEASGGNNERDEDIDGGGKNDMLDDSIVVNPDESPISDVGGSGNDGSRLSTIGAEDAKANSIERNEVGESTKAVDGEFVLHNDNVRKENHSQESLLEGGNVRGHKLANQFNVTIPPGYRGGPRYNDKGDFVPYSVGQGTNGGRGRKRAISKSFPMDLKGMGFATEDSFAEFHKATAEMNSAKMEMDEKFAMGSELGSRSHGFQTRSMFRNSFGSLDGGGVSRTNAYAASSSSSSMNAGPIFGSGFGRQGMGGTVVENRGQTVVNDGGRPGPFTPAPSAMRKFDFGRTGFR